jgi:hypothetical protein
MKTILIAATAAVALPVAAPAPAFAQSREVRREMRECERELRRADSRREYNKELRECRREIREERREVRRETRRDRREALRDWRQARRYDWNRHEPGFDRYYADRYYRPGNYYADRQMAWNDRVYRGEDGRFYCRRSDGTTGLIVGAGLGALIGNQLDVGGSATLRTVIGGAAGALIGRQVDRGNVRCD